jgi:hypothetical protein
MKKRDWYLMFGGLLILLSALLYALHYAIFGDAHHIYLYLLGDLAFLPLEVLFVTLIIDRLLAVRERAAILEKMNMVIGAFFSEVGTELLRMLCSLDPGCGEKARVLEAAGKEGPNHLADRNASVGDFEFDIEVESPIDLRRFKTLLAGKRDFMVRLLENPLLLEHESFTDLLWAVFHLTDELDHREDPGTLKEGDIAHIEGDMSRAYGFLARQWFAYMVHLEKNYPYLYSLALRLNPFDPSATAEIGV